MIMSLSEKDAKSTELKNLSKCGRKRSMSPTHHSNFAASRGRLAVRPAPLIEQKEVVRGLLPLGLEMAGDAFLYVPLAYQTDSPLPFVLLLHGAGGNARGGLTPFLLAADMAGLILLAPSSREQTWDVIIDDYGEDVSFIDRLLSHVFKQYAIDTSHLAIGGFSDGASYALSLGLTNGDLFTHIIAFSPGFMAPASRQGMPFIFISHGTQDTILPIDRCSRRIVRQLQREHYDVHYHEFDGPHTIPLEIVQEAWTWFSGAGG
jgi:phospholipase/carboxylesterase